jgi:dTDP-D-glucose 4,6-dehydratase
VLDKLTSASLPYSLEPASTSNRHGVVQADICDPVAVAAALAGSRLDVITHLSAKSHVNGLTDATKIRDGLGWTPSATIEEGIQTMVRGYLENRGWWHAMLDGRDKTERLVVAHG